jgi:hypothetical protein
MFHMSLKYIHLLHVSTSLGHLQVTFFFYRTAHIVTRTLECAVVWCHMASPLPVVVLRLPCAPLGVPPLGRVRAVSVLSSRLIKIVFR